MQYSLSKLNPANLQALKDSLDDTQGVQIFLEKLMKFLSGKGKSIAEQDLAFSTASELSASGIFDALPIDDIAETLEKVEKSKAFAFKAGLASHYRNKLEQIETKNAQQRSKAKKIHGYLKLIVPAGAANPSPPIGPALGQRGLNIMEFCNAFNAKTSQVEKGIPIAVVITIFHDKSFSFEVNASTTSNVLVETAASNIGRRRGMQVRGERGPHTRKSGATITAKQVREIAEAKMVDLSFDDTETARRDVMRQAKQMGIIIEDN